MSRIFIVGARSLGVATGTVLLQAGHRVTFVEAEPGTARELTVQGMDVRPGLDLAGEPESFVFLCRPTAPEPGRARTAEEDPAGYDLGGIEDGAVEIGRALAAADARHI